MAYLRQLAVVALLTTTATIASASSGSGTTTRYWDCCKPSCAWNDLDTLGIESAVKSCDANDNPLKTTTDASGCSGGSAYMCSDQSPWAVDDNTAYGFAAVSASSPACCQCYKLTFTSTAIAGKTMIVQATNTGGDVGSTQFDIAMPGGGFGIFDGCSTEWGATSSIWGAQYGGSSTNTCSSFPKALQPGCGFRWDWFGGADNPTVDWETVACPAAITAKSGCVRKGDTPTGSAPASSSSSAKAASTSSTAKAATSAASSTEAAPVASSTAAAPYSSAPVASAASSSESAVETPATSAASSIATQSAPFSVPFSSTTFAVVKSSAAYSPSEVAPLPTSSLEASFTSAAIPESTEPAAAEPSAPADGGDDDTCEL